MNNGIDYRPIQLLTEEYIGYGRIKQNLDKMSYMDLREELILADKHVKLAQEDLDSNGPHPTYVIKEQLKNAIHYKNKIQEKIETLSKTEKEAGSIKNIKQDLKTQLDKNTITKDFYDKCIENLNERESKIKELEGKVDK